MAMPLSGCLGIKSCPGGTCTSISQAVDGNVTGNKCLGTLSSSVGKTAPHCMRAFYGYTPVTVNKVLNITLINETGNGIDSQCTCGCLQPSAVVPAGNYYYPNYCWCMAANNVNATSACVSVKCNGTVIYTCAVTSNIYNCSGSWTTSARYVDYDDLIHITTCASTAFGTGYAHSTIRLSSITQGLGTYCLGGTIIQTSSIGGEIE